MNARTVCLLGKVDPAGDRLDLFKIMTQKGSKTSEELADGASSQPMTRIHVGHASVPLSLLETPVAARAGSVEIV